MSKKNYHSVPWDGDWAVKKEGVAAPLSIHRKQSAAEAQTREHAKAYDTEAVYHNRKGQIKDKDSFGNDPFPPRDRKP